MRLPVYLRYAKKLLEAGETVVSCTTIAEEFGQSSVQVRKDLALTGVSGRPRVGYPLRELVEAIETLLGWNKKTRAYLVGVGGLGSAILGYDHFADCGLVIAAAFDTDPAKIGTCVHNHLVYPVDQLTEFGSAEQIDIGVLTLPAPAAQEAAEKLVKIGVRGIWNFTPNRLILPPHIVCENVRLSSSFAILAYCLMNTPQN